MIIFAFPIGKLLDKIGRKKPLIVSNILVVPATLIFIYGNYLTIFIAMILMGLTMLLGFSSYQTMFADLVPQALRGKVIGSLNFFTYISMALGAVLGGFLYDNVSPLLPFFLMIIFAIPSTLLAFLVHEPKPEERQV
jgi:MFS family permease